MKQVPLYFIIATSVMSVSAFAQFTKSAQPVAIGSASPAAPANTANAKTSAPISQPVFQPAQNRASVPVGGTTKTATPPQNAAAISATTKANTAPPKVTAVATPVPAAPTPPPATDSPVESILSEDMIRALRDPFQLPSILMVHKDSPKTDLENFQLKDFRLNGVITGPKKTRAMLTAPGNKVYFVRTGDKIGVRDGTITQILPDAIKIVEYFTDEHGKRIPDTYELMMSGELVSLNKKEE